MNKIELVILQTHLLYTLVLQEGSLNGEGSKYKFVIGELTQGIFFSQAGRQPSPLAFQSPIIPLLGRGVGYTHVKCL